MSSDLVQDLKYRKDIDGLRALAVLSVIFYHAGFNAFSGGFTGVDVFFVISGFLITQHLTRDIETKRSISLLNFYSKRFRRLYPALITVIISTLIIWFIFFKGDISETKHFVRSVKYSIFGLANIFFKNESGGYFDNATEEMPLLHFWSLAVEEQFYLIWPLIIIGIYRKNPKFFLYRLKFFLIIIIFLSFSASSYFLWKNESSISFYLMPLRAWELAVGGLAVFSISKIKISISEKKAKGLSLLGLLLIIFPIFYLDSTYQFPGLWACPSVFGTFIVILAGAKKENKILSSNLLVFLGSISYGWYLWHWPLFASARKWNLGWPLSATTSWMIIISSAFLAWVSLNYIEKPIRLGLIFPKWNNRKTIAISITAGFIISAMAQALRTWEKSSIDESIAKINRYTFERNTLFKKCVDKTHMIGSNDCERRNSKNIKKIIYMWGDSHAHSFFPMLENYIKEHNDTAAVLYSFSGTPPLLKTDDLVLQETKIKTNEAILEDIKKRIFNNPEIIHSVILTARWKRYGGLSTIANDPVRFLDKKHTYEGTLKTLEESLWRTIDMLQKSGVHRITIFTAFPEFKYQIKRCYLLKRDECTISHSQLMAYFEDTNRIFERLKSKSQNIHLLNFLPFLCQDGQCPQYIQTKKEIYPIVRDDDHPSAIIAQKLMLLSLDELNWLVDQ